MTEHVDEVFGYVHVLERKVVGEEDATENLDFTVCDYCGRETDCDENRKNTLRTQLSSSFSNARVCKRLSENVTPAGMYQSERRRM